MAFGSPRSGSPLTASSTNAGTGVTVSGSIGVSAGDLIVVNYAIRQDISVSASDNLGGSYTALNAGGASNGRSYAFYKYVTADGILNNVTASHASSDRDSALVVAIFEGPFAPSPLDINAAILDDSTSPFTGNATGTLNQTLELVIGHMAQSNGATEGSYGANNSFTLHGAASSGTGTNTCSGALCYRVVSATDSVTPEFTSGVSSSGQVGTASFLQGAAAALASTEATDTAAIEITASNVLTISVTEPSDSLSAEVGVNQIRFDLEATEATDLMAATVIRQGRTTSSFYEVDPEAGSENTSSSFYREV